MLGRNHVIVSFAVGYAVTPVLHSYGLVPSDVFFAQENWPFMSALIVGALLPDALDSEEGSTLTNMFSFGGIKPLKIIPKLVGAIFGHRGVIHWPEVWVAMGAALFYAGAPMPIVVGIVIGSFLHLAEDAVTWMGLDVPPTLRALMYVPYLVTLPLKLVGIKPIQPLKNIPFFVQQGAIINPSFNKNMPESGNNVKFTPAKRFWLFRPIRFHVGGLMEEIIVWGIVGIVLLSSFAPQYLSLDFVNKVGTAVQTTATQQAQ